jgi:hypothetical protein
MSNKITEQPFCQTRVMCRYSLYERKDLNSKILWSGTNKAEMKKVRTGWKYQITHLLSKRSEMAHNSLIDEIMPNDNNNKINNI